MNIQNDRVLRYKQAGDIRLKCSLNLKQLFCESKKRRLFDQKWPEFLASHENNKDVYSLKGDTLEYLSEQLIPTKINNKPSLLMVLGNPATQSIQNQMFFSFEGNQKEHRFWKHILKPAKILSLLFDAQLPVKQLNSLRKKQLLNLSYDSGYRIGLCVFVTMPSAAGGPWGGVAGIKKLIGKDAFERLEKEETLRIIEVAKRFVGNKGRLIVFQKNAWDRLRSDKDPEYTLERARTCKLQGALKGLNKIPVFGVPPTRLSKPCKKAVEHFCTEEKSRVASLFLIITVGSW